MDLEVAQGTNRTYMHYRTRGYKGLVYPTGEFTCGYDKASYEGEKKASREYERVHDLQYHELRDAEGHIVDTIPLDVAQVYCPSEVGGQEERLALGLSTLANSRKPRRHGLKGISSKGKLKVKSSAYLLERRYGRRRLTFATVTIPPLEEGDRKYLHDNWSVFVNRLIEEIKRELKRNGYPTHIVAVTEIQEARFKRTGAVYLHLHMVWVGCGVRAGVFGIQANWLRRKMSCCLNNLLDGNSQQAKCGNEEREIDVLAAIDLQRVRRSVSAYLGKYLSKGTRLRSADISESDRQSFPRQWWYTTRSLKLWLARCMQPLAHEECDLLVNDAKYREEKCIWAVHITTEYNNVTYVMGMCGRFKPGGEHSLAKTFYAILEPRE